jgi:hypothetical protein
MCISSFLLFLFACISSYSFGRSPLWILRFFLGVVVWRSYVTLCSFLFPFCVVFVVLWFISFLFFLCSWFCGVVSLVALLRCVFVSWNRHHILCCILFSKWQSRSHWTLRVFGRQIYVIVNIINSCSVCPSPSRPKITVYNGH